MPTTFDPNLDRPPVVPLTAWWCAQHRCYHATEGMMIVDWFPVDATLEAVNASRNAGNGVRWFDVPPRGAQRFDYTVEDPDDDEDEDHDEDADDEGDCDCTMCVSNQSDTRRLIHNYGYKPDPMFLGDGPLYLGAEIEVECGSRRSRAARCVADHLDGERIGYMKTDGSLSCGIEIVTHPMSYAWAIENFPWEMFEELELAGAYTQPENTGLHVHVSRAGFRSQYHTMSWMRFIYEHQRQVCTFAGRESAQWASFRRNAKDLAYAAKGGTNLERYRAINVQNYSTLEMRVFASSLKPAHIKATLGFVDASVRFAGTISSHDALTKKRGLWGDFTEYVTSHDVYKPLGARLRELALIPA